MNQFDAALLIIFGVITVSIVLFDVIYSIRKNGVKPTLAAAEEFAANIIMAVGLKLVTDAERQYGAGTGQLKMASAVAELIKLLPDWVVERVPKSWLMERLESVLTAAKVKWNANPLLLGTSEKDE